ncbi:hypothetical protein WEI85_45695 [Actinomycetes bacterium KLBMP 9797]
MPIRHTLPELLRDERVRELFQDLRDEGWKDWHLLSVVMNRTVNHRVEARYGPITAERIGQLKDAIFDEALRDEPPPLSRSARYLAPAGSRVVPGGSG